MASKRTKKLLRVLAQQDMAQRKELLHRVNEREGKLPPCKGAVVWTDNEGHPVMRDAYLSASRILSMQPTPHNAYRHRLVITGERLVHGAGRDGATKIMPVYSFRKVYTRIHRRMKRQYPRGKAFYRVAKMEWANRG